MVNFFLHLDVKGCGLGGNINFPYATRAMISCVIAGIFIYIRKLDYYATMPRGNLGTSLLIVIWVYLNYMEPLALPVGLLLLNIFGKKMGGASGYSGPVGHDAGLLRGASEFQTGWKI